MRDEKGMNFSTEALFSSEKFLDLATIVFLFYLTCLIMD